MKLKKAMKLYPIIFEPKTVTTNPVWRLADKYIMYLKKAGEWRAPLILFNSKREAVAWLIEGAEKKPESECRTFVEYICPCCGIKLGHYHISNKKVEVTIK